MIVLPLKSTTRAPAGIATEARGPTARIRLPSIRMTPSSTMPPSALAMVTTRAPTRAVRPVGMSAGTVIESEVPAVGGTYAAPPGALRIRSEAEAV
jgi:hypothetical protein